MKLGKFLSLILVIIMALSFCMVVNAEDIAIAGSNQQTALDLTTAPAGVYINMSESFCSASFRCPSWSNNIGIIHMGIYLWLGDYQTTIEGRELYGKDFVDFADGASLKFEFPTAPAGEYLILMQGRGTDTVGVWTCSEVSSKAKEIELTFYYKGAINVTFPHGTIVTGKNPTLGELNISQNPGEMIDIGTDKTSERPARPFEEKISESIIMYTGSPLAYVNAQSKMIDKYNKWVTPYVDSGYTLLPVRFVTENLGATLAWNDATQHITITKDDIVIELSVGVNFMSVNGEIRAIDMAPKIVNTRTMVPLRAVTEALNIPIHWRQDGENGLIIIGETCNDLGYDVSVIGTLLARYKLAN